MSQTELGDALAAYGYELAQPLIYRVEAGRRALRLNEAAAFAAVLGVTLADLIGADDDPGRQAALNATIETAQQASEAIAAAEEAQYAVDEAQRQLDQATQTLRAAVRRRTDAVVAYELAAMRYNALPTKGV